MAARLKWQDDKVTLFEVEVRREPHTKSRDAGWTLTAHGPNRLNFNHIASDEADTDVVARQLALAARTIYGLSIPNELVKAVNADVRVLERGDTKKGG